MLLDISSKDIVVQGENAFVKPWDRKPGVIMIHATWCSHCRVFKPVLASLAKQIGPDFSVVALEYNEFANNAELDTALGVSSFPTIKFFDRTGRITNTYTGARTENALSEHICEFYNQCPRR